MRTAGSTFIAHSDGLLRETGVDQVLRRDVVVRMTMSAVVASMAAFAARAADEVMKGVAGHDDPSLVGGRGLVKPRPSAPSACF